MNVPFHYSKIVATKATVANYVSELPIGTQFSVASATDHIATEVANELEGDGNDLDLGMIEGCYIY